MPESRQLKKWPTEQYQETQDRVAAMDIDPMSPPSLEEECLIEAYMRHLGLAWLQ